MVSRLSCLLSHHFLDMGTRVVSGKCAGMTARFCCDLAMAQGVQTLIMGWEPFQYHVRYNESLFSPDTNYENVIIRKFPLPSMAIRLYIWMMPWSSPLFLEQIGEWHIKT